MTRKGTKIMDGGHTRMWHAPMSKSGTKTPAGRTQPQSAAADKGARQGHAGKRPGGKVRKA